MTTHRLKIHEQYAEEFAADLWNERVSYVD